MHGIGRLFLCGFKLFKSSGHAVDRDRSEADMRSPEEAMLIGEALRLYIIQFYR